MEANINRSTLVGKLTLIIMIRTNKVMLQNPALHYSSKYWIKLVKNCAWLSICWAVLICVYSMNLRKGISLIHSFVWHWWTKSFIMSWREATAANHLQNRTPPEITLIFVCQHSITFAFISGAFTTYSKWKRTLYFYLFEFILVFGQYTLYLSANTCVARKNNTKKHVLTFSYDCNCCLALCHKSELK